MLGFEDTVAAIANDPEYSLENLSKVNQSVLNKDTKYLLFKYVKERCLDRNETHSQIIGTFEEKEDSVFCPRRYDGYACWDETPAGYVAFQNCPAYIYGFDHRFYAYKTCTENGTWYINPETKYSYTNYTTCVNMEDLQFRTTITNIYIVGYAISLVGLMLSLLIFTYYRSLQCTRVRIHKHLFSSFAANNVLWIIWFTCIPSNVTVLINNPIWCQGLHLFANYFMVTGYGWMFCEGLHLHLSLVVVFLDEKRSMKLFKFFGWGLPLLIVIVYGTVRFFVYRTTKRCWIDQDNSLLVLTVPVAASFVISIVFLINVVRVLVNKLRSGAHSVTEATKKAVRATLILIPLFGLHFILIPVSPPPESEGEHVYSVISASVTCLQGTFLSVLFCFYNNEVIAAIKGQCAHSTRAGTNENIPMTGTTGGDTLLNSKAAAS